MKTLRELFANAFRKGFAGHETVTGFDFRYDDELRPLRAIRAKCFECQAGQLTEIRECTMYDCSLWPYRAGKRPKKKAKEAQKTSPA